MWDLLLQASWTHHDQGIQAPSKILQGWQLSAKISDSTWTKRYHFPATLIKNYTDRRDTFKNILHMSLNEGASDKKVQYFMQFYVFLRVMWRLNVVTRYYQNLGPAMCVKIIFRIPGPIDTFGRNAVNKLRLRARSLSYMTYSLHVIGNCFVLESSWDFICCIFFGK